MKPNVPPEIEATLQASAARGRAAWAEGNLPEAEAAFLEAWHAIPEPRLDYDLGQIMARGFVVFFRDTKQLAKAYQWLETTRQVYGPENPSLQFLAGTVAFAAEDFPEAFRFFDALYRAYGSRPFRGESRAYLDFYRQYARKH